MEAATPQRELVKEQVKKLSKQGVRKGGGGGEKQRESSWPFPGQSPEELREALAYPMGSFPDRAWPLGWS